MIFGLSISTASKLAKNFFSTVKESYGLLQLWSERSMNMKEFQKVKSYKEQWTRETLSGTRLEE